MTSDTKTKILETSRTLFNAFGVEGTSVKAICNELGITPGNLTYHFPRKVDILLALEQRFQESVHNLQIGLAEGIRRGDRAITARETVLLLYKMVELIWRDRFYISSYTALAKLDESIIRRFAAMEKSARHGLATLVQLASDAGVMRELRHPNSVQRMADNIWHIIWGRMLFALMTAANTEPKSEDVAHECLVGVLALIEPHVPRDFALEMLAEL